MRQETLKHPSFWRSIIRLCRPLQWVKNLLVFVPLIFAGKCFDMEYVLPCVPLFFAFCFASSGIYCLNDVRDADEDKLHPTKCKRPIASGKLTKQQGLYAMIVCWFLAILILFIGPANRDVISLVLSYVLLNIAYTYILKQYVIVDVCVIALGFAMRIYGCHLASDIFVSMWIVLMVFMGALFLAMSKRLHDVKLLESKGIACRKTSHSYSRQFLTYAISLEACFTMGCYIMYSIAPEVIQRFHCSYLYITSVFVIIGILRYLKLAFSPNNLGDPLRLMLDKFILLCLVLWAMCFAYIIYF